MGPQDHLRALPDGIRCTVCEERVPADRLKLLARRDNLLFLQVGCEACGSTALGFITDSTVFAEAGHLPGHLPGVAPMSADDVLDMHELLESWTGDLVSLVGESDGRAVRRDRPEPGRTGRHA